MNKFPLIEKKLSNYTKICEAKNFFTVENENGFFRAKNQTTTSLLDTKLKKKANGYLYEIILFGLNYNAKRIKSSRRQFYLDLQKSHRILIDETVETPFRTRIFKRRIILFGYDSRCVLNTINLIRNMKPQNSYFGHGAIVNIDKFKLKPGKVKQK